MRPIRMDFSRDSDAPSAAGVTLLRLGLAAVVVSAACYVTVSGEIDRLEARASETNGKARKMPARLTEAPGDARETQQEIRNANQGSVICCMTWLALRMSWWVSRAAAGAARKLQSEQGQH